MDEITLSQAVKEALVSLTQELAQSYSLPQYLKPLLDGEATVVFKVYKGKVQLTAPIRVMPVVAVTEEPPKIEVVELETPKAETEATEEPAKTKRKRKNEV